VIQIRRKGSGTWTGARRFVIWTGRAWHNCLGGERVEDIPVVVVACLRLSAYGPIVSGWRPPFPPFLAAIYYGSIFPAVQNVLLAARAGGLGASLTVMRSGTYRSRDGRSGYRSGCRPSR
jgi:hypothetical protein